MGLEALDVLERGFEADSEEPDAECKLEWIWLATWEDSREDVRWWPRLMKADGGLKATAAPVIIAGLVTQSVASVRERKRRGDQTTSH